MIPDKKTTVSIPRDPPKHQNVFPMYAENLNTSIFFAHIFTYICVYMPGMLLKISHYASFLKLTVNWFKEDYIRKRSV